MRAYNPMTVIRQTSRSVLKEFFTEHRCLECLNFEKDKLYEPQKSGNCHAQCLQSCGK